MFFLPGTDGFDVFCIYLSLVNAGQEAELGAAKLSLELLQKSSVASGKSLNVSLCKEGDY